MKRILQIVGLLLLGIVILAVIAAVVITVQFNNKVR